MVTAKAAVKTTTAADPGPVQPQDVERGRGGRQASGVGLEGKCSAARTVAPMMDGYASFLILKLP
ncbi:hypothetical protein E2562_032297 [Oryza meyeriana var. granulata]|uniref:Uncharacterized protein n=1 Tax=Oryza meyeriana var. granulata TaxID=110450 RepID=A0A6G1F0J7_9ORYZ|nr:hypothetical protein E2562_032297 [Oryza meyeriana var. granulata]